MEFMAGALGEIVSKSVRFGAASLLALALPAHAQQLAQNDINQMSIEQLANVEITSVSKAAEPLSDAPASIYVISHDDVIRSGAQSVPEMLRLAPNLEVMQTSPSQYVITSRGLNGNSADQSFPDKLLILIDGRSAYNPLFSGVYWDMQDVLPENIDRIEVISGPGGTEWGANAINGVINIVTRNSADTKGGLIDLGVGDQTSSAALQYGGQWADNLTYRLYAKDFYQRADATVASPGVPSGSAHDGWTKPQGGFRLDWTPGQDQVSLEGDIFGGAEAQTGLPFNMIAGGNVTARWQHPMDDGQNLQVLSYYDEEQRTSLNGGSFYLNSYDLEFQHNFTFSNWNSVVWGAGERIDQYRIHPRLGAANSLIFSPGSRVLNLADIFGEDRIALADGVQLTLGLKLEDDPYSGVTPMPSGRLSWKIDPHNLIWGSVSRAIRSPTPFDVDVVEKVGTGVFLTGNADFLPEDVIAYEAGWRGQVTQDLSVSVTGFDDFYSNLRSIEPTPVSFVPLYWGKGIGGNIYGLESWANYQLTDWWRLAAGLTWQHDDLKFVPGASGFLGVAQDGNDPHHQASLRSSMNLADGLTFDADFREVGQLPNPHVPEFVELNARLGWQVNDRLDLSLSGFNLLHGHHVEYAPGDAIRRNFFLETKWRF